MPGRLQKEHIVALADNEMALLYNNKGCQLLLAHDRLDDTEYLRANPTSNCRYLTWHRSLISACSTSTVPEEAALSGRIGNTDRPHADALISLTPVGHTRRHRIFTLRSEFDETDRFSRMPLASVVLFLLQPPRTDASAAKAQTALTARDMHSCTMGVKRQ